MGDHQRRAGSSETLEIGKGDLSIEQVVAVARAVKRDNENEYSPKVTLNDQARDKLKEVRKYIVQNWLNQQNSPSVYGFNTGIGSLKNKVISLNDIDKFQKLLIRAHCVGVGEPLREEIVRAAMLLRAHTLALGYSGVRPEVIERLLEMLNRGVHPVIPEKGSLCASGDLAPLAHLAAAMIGEGEAEAYYHGKRMRAREALKKAGLEAEFQLKAKEALALINGTSVTLAIGVLVVHDALRLLKDADIAAALSLEAVRGEQAAFYRRLHEVRKQPGQIACAENIRRLIEGSSRMSEDARQVKLWDKRREGETSEPNETREDGTYEPRIQDAYSLRCVPQVHGASRDAIRYVRQVIENEINAVTDNPLIFEDGTGKYVAVSGGNFHGQPLALALDFLGIALAEIGNISERRIFRLLSPDLSYGLPPNLSGGKPGLNTGLMIAQYTAAALVAENKILAHPASVDSIPTSADQEDHVSMGMNAALKALRILENVQHIIGIEYLCAAQAISLTEEELKNFQCGKGTQKAYEVIRKNNITPIYEDKYLHTDIQKAVDLVRSGIIVKEVEKAIGELK